MEALERFLYAAMVVVKFVEERSSFQTSVFSFLIGHLSVNSLIRGALSGILSAECEVTD